MQFDNNLYTCNETGALACDAERAAERATMRRAYLVRRAFAIRYRPAARRVLPAMLYAATLAAGALAFGAMLGLAT